jgi:serine/threonine protein kinase
MTPERWNLVTGLFHRVLEYAPDDRGAFLDAECPDAEVRLEVEALLSEFADDDPFLETRHREAAIGAVFHEVRQVAAGVAPGYILDDKYHIEALLGRGGMGAVYRATQLHIDRQVAVKLLLGPVQTSNLALSRFKREAFAVASLRHRNIVALYDFGIADEAGAYLVMEYLEGESLREALTRRGPLDVELAIELVRQTCAALCVVHATGTVHRDLKPYNYFLKLVDDGPTV